MRLKSGGVLVIISLDGVYLIFAASLKLIEWHILGEGISFGLIYMMMWPLKRRLASLTTYALNSTQLSVSLSGFIYRYNIQFMFRFIIIIEANGAFECSHPISFAF